MKYQEQIISALNATSISFSNEFSWFGRSQGRLPQLIEKTIDAQMARAHLLQQIQRRLYLSFYCCGYPKSENRHHETINAGGDPSFVQAMSDANVGKGYHTSGWIVQALADKDVVVQRHGLTLKAPRENCLTIDNQEVRNGDQVKVHLPNEQLGISPGYYMALSDLDFASSEGQSRVRIYWNVTPQGAASLMAQITHRFNNLNIPFRFKILNDPREFTQRCDTAVLYIPQVDYAQVCKAIIEIYEEVSQWLRPGNPALTKPLLPGISLAEDPKSGNSYGFHRCQILADAIIRAHELGVKSLSERLAIVSESFLQEGISIETPFLNPGSKDTYSCNYTPSHKLSLADSVNVTASLKLDTSIYLQTARAIAQQLSDTAYWHEDRCTWLAPNLESAHSASSLHNPYQMLGPMLYDGTAGIALFLSEVAATTGDRSIRDLAFGAMRQALARIEDVPDSSRFGLYSGWLGIALCSARIGIRHQQSWFVDEANKLVRHAAQYLEQPQEFDVINGLAGGILSLIALNNLLNEPFLINFAEQLGDKLIAIAEHSTYGSSWRAIDQPMLQRNLTGYSHGTAGVAHAFVELFAIAGNQKYKQIAEQAFGYERHWFAANTLNWPDFRLDENQPRTKASDRHKFMCAWCHGAPGIALSRLRAYQILGDHIYKTEAAIALNTTRESIKKSLTSGISDSCLCHGLLGNAEILLHGNQVLKEEHLQDTELAVNAAQAIMASKDFHESLAKDLPGFMIGLAGVGYFLVRLYDPKIPSVLAVNFL